uniref:Uncharacterized protein n=1 Tax=Serinus canaria TaxID=9135 RepID=A0A8C9UIC0_SERCA
MLSELGAMSEGPAGMAAPAAMAETRLRRKQLLSAEEAELFELAQAAGSGLDPEVAVIVLCQLLQLLGAFQLSPALSPLSGGRNKSSSAVTGSQILAERSSREGSAQRMPRQPSASRVQKAGTSGKSSGGANST